MCWSFQGGGVTVEGFRGCGRSRHYHTQQDTFWHNPPTCLYSVSECFHSASAVSVIPCIIHIPHLPLEGGWVCPAYFPASSSPSCAITFNNILFNPSKAAPTWNLSRFARWFKSGRVQYKACLQLEASRHLTASRENTKLRSLTTESESRRFFLRVRELHSVGR